jgi:hypothetical protein
MAKPKAEARKPPLDYSVLTDVSKLIGFVKK